MRVSYVDIAGLNGSKDRGYTNAKHIFYLVISSSAITVTGIRGITIPSVGQ